MPTTQLLRTAEKAQTMTETYGRSQPESSRQCSPELSSWKMFQESWGITTNVLGQSYSQWGTQIRKDYSRRMKLAPARLDRGYLCSPMQIKETPPEILGKQWPTPRASNPARGSPSRGRTLGGDIQDMANSISDRSRRWKGGRQFPTARPTTRHRPAFPPSPRDNEEWAQVLAEMPSLEPAFCRVADGLAPFSHREHWLRLLGNGVVPLVAAHAIRTLATRTGLEL